MKAQLSIQNQTLSTFPQRLEWLLAASEQITGPIEQMSILVMSEEGEKYFEDQAFDAEKWQAYQAQENYPSLFNKRFELDAIGSSQNVTMFAEAIESEPDPYEVLRKMEDLARWTDAKWPDQFLMAEINTFDQGFVRLRRQQDSTYAQDTGWSMWGWPGNFWVGGPLAYIHIFSKHFYTEFASREEMLALPAVRVEEWPTGSILLQIYPDAHDPLGSIRAARAFREQVGQRTLTPQRKVLSISQRLKLE